ncbi:ribonuclease E/G [Seohaeicola sp. SP36]|uniref:Rne/Rng family ribonuclease n=1 Tax=unclassified Seohaeicola TaxID=2641111 RepID=UPI00237ADFC6|nr:MULTISPECIES: ribonuclease E/G [unclassified Seohaeicola]MDD9707200.1 ribonuclease E/G [Seohaeicola sp. 4SK31]MDD9735441.1 ribonuclease E/G [Seohaeicola sp. SP36]
MAKKMLIDATHAEETRVVVVDGNKVEEFDFESENKRQLAGNIYLAKVTRVEPSLQAAFVDYGGNRHGFLAFSEIHPDYYQIPVADRQALMEEEQAYADAQRREDEDEKPRSSRSRSRSGSRSRSEAVRSDDAVATRDAEGDEIAGMETIDLDEGEVSEGTSPMEIVAETPVEEPADLSDDNDDEDDDGAVETMDRDDSIESVSDDDDAEDIRPVRKPRARRYKIQEVIKVRQILLVQVVKEERGNKGAALTTYLSLAGRYCVLMPNTARGGGISRKITNAVDRKKLKEIATEIDVPKGAGLIVRTAGAKRTKTEIKRDYEYLLRLWEQIRELTLKSVAPAKIYEEGDLIKRSIRDLYSREIDEVLVEGERGYRIAKDFMKMIMPSHAVNVKHYREQMPLFARYQVESYLSSMFNPTVQLKSGGYIVIGVTEALVAIDVNSGRATKEGSIEETALKTNLEAAEEVARQLRLRDLAGLIVIDFIDMDERRNNAAVEKRIKDKLKTDRARIQVGRISGFGLMEMSRQRLRPGMIEATTQPCAHCHGTGLIRSDDNLALSILRQIEEEGVRRRSREVLIKAPVGIANYLMNMKRDHVAQIEGRYGLSVRIEGDPTLISPDFTMEKFKTATRVVVEVPQVISADTALMDEVDGSVSVWDLEEAEAAEEEAAAKAAARPERAERAERAERTAEAGDDEAKPKKRRRRRRRGKSKTGAEGESNGDNGSYDDDSADEGDDTTTEVIAAEETAEAPVVAAEPAAADSAATSEAAAEAEAEGKKPARKTVTRTRSTSSRTAAAKAETAPKAPSKPKAPAKPRAKTAAAKDAAPAAEAEAKPAKKPATRSRTPKAAKDAAAETAAPSDAVAPAAASTTVEPVAPAPAKAEQVAVSEAVQAEPVKDEPAKAEAAKVEAPQAEAKQPEEDGKPRRKGWWSLGR